MYTIELEPSLYINSLFGVGDDSVLTLNLEYASTAHSRESMEALLKDLMESWPNAKVIEVFLTTDRPGE